MIIEGVERLDRFIREKEIKNFRPQEFVCPHCGDVKIDSVLVLTLQRLRGFLGEPVIITSAYRCPQHNREIGGVPDSAHVKGYAVDIRSLGSRYRYRVLRFLFRELITRVGIGKEFIHFDIDPGKPKGVVWDYYKAKHVA
jgi:uncharacterized protein YcbK (DUF882 family)